MAADELAWGHFQLELIGKLDASFFLSFTASICNEYVWSVGEMSAGSRPDSVLNCLHFDAVLVLAIEDLHGFDGLRNDTAAFDKDTIDIESVGIFVGRL